MSARAKLAAFFSVDLADVVDAHMARRSRALIKRSTLHSDVPGGQL